MRYPIYAVLVMLVLIPIGPVVSRDDKGKAAPRPSTQASGDPVSREDLALLSRYAGKAKLPADLLKAYARFVRAAKDPKTTPKALESYCLPGSVEIADAGRPNPELGRGLNLPFLRSGFGGEILGITELPDGCYAIRTGTSRFSWVQTKSGAWMLYSASDKPIQ